MKIKSSEYWAMREQLQLLKEHEGDVRNLRAEAQMWRGKYEQLQTGGVDGKLEREKAFERGRQHGVLSLRGHLMDALNSLASGQPGSRETPVNTA